MGDPYQPEPGETRPYGTPQYQPYVPPQPHVTAPGPMAPYGVDPVTGQPYSDKSKLVAGLLQILVPMGIGRYYTGHTGLATAQLLVTVLTCGVGSIWPFVDGIVLLAGRSRDARGRLLRG